MRSSRSSTDGSELLKKGKKKELKRKVQTADRGSGLLLLFSLHFRNKTRECCAEEASSARCYRHAGKRGVKGDGERARGGKAAALACKIPLFCKQQLAQPFVRLAARLRRSPSSLSSSSQPLLSSPPLSLTGFFTYFQPVFLLPFNSLL